MEITDWPSVLMGFQLAFGIQLTLISIIYFMLREKKSTLIAFVYLIIGICYISGSLWDYWPYNTVLVIIFSEGKRILIPVLLYLYFRQLREDLHTRTIFKHLFLPFLFELINIFQIITINELGHFFSIWDISILSFAFLGICIVYFIMIFRELKYHLKKTLIKRAYVKYTTFFFITSIYITIIPIKSIIFSKSFTGGNDFMNNYDNSFLDYYTTYFSAPISYLFTLCIVFYAISELSIFKTLFLPKNLNSKNLDSFYLELSTKIKKSFNDDKLFKISGLTLEDSAQILNCSKVILSKYLKENQKTTFKDFVNQLRIQEFKEMLHNEQYNHYDLVGLAKECGFNSKSTFFRVFKEQEGCTPNEYKNKTTSTNTKY